MTTDTQKLLADALADLVAAVEDNDRDSLMELLAAHKALATYRAQQEAATSEPLPDHADHVAEIAIRLRRVARLAGVAEWVPEDDKTAVGCIFSVLGRMANVMESNATNSQDAKDAAQELTDFQIDNRTRHIYYAGKPVSAGYRIGIVRAAMQKAAK